MPVILTNEMIIAVRSLLGALDEDDLPEAVVRLPMYVSQANSAISDSLSGISIQDVPPQDIDNIFCYALAELLTIHCSGLYQSASGHKAQFKKQAINWKEVRDTLFRERKRLTSKITGSRNQNNFFAVIGKTVRT